MHGQVKAGSLVLLHGANVHYSNENTSGKSRHAYSVHVVEGGGGMTWPADNWCAWRLPGHVHGDAITPLLACR